MTEQRDDHEATAKRIVQGWIDGGEKDDLIAAVAAALAEAEDAAFVNGLERAKDIISDIGLTRFGAPAIQARIDKEKK